jgi:ABC-type multidrug transport system fused ATPase/permease subunit
VGITFLIKVFWRFQKPAFFYLAGYCLVSGVLPFASIIIPKYILDELLGAQDVFTLATLVSVLLASILLGHTLLNFFDTQFTLSRLRCAQSFFKDMDYHNYEADLEYIEGPVYRELRQRALRFLLGNSSFGDILWKFVTIIAQSITLVGIISVIAVLHPAIVLLFVSLILFSAWFNSEIKKKNIQFDVDVAKNNNRIDYLERLIDDRLYAKEIRNNALGKWIIDLKQSWLTKVNGSYKKVFRNSFKTRVVGNLVSFVQQGVSYLYLIYAVLHGQFGIGSFTMYLAAITAFSGAMFSLMDSIVDIRRFSDYYNALEGYLNPPRKLREGKQLPLKTDTPVVFEFRAVSFRYSGQTAYALRNINLTIGAGEKLSVVGENGAGKSTLVKLLMRLYQPTEGHILINGVDIQDYDFDDYEKLFSAVFQDFVLYTMSLRDNLSLGHAVDEAKLVEALKKSGLENKLESLERGLDTFIHRDFDEDGFEPSGGEGQKIALARALVKDAPVVILDEPTAALDPRAEYEIYQNFNQMVSGKTAVFISHRLSSAQFCDKIAVLKGGELVEYGPHAELVAKNGLYQELFTMQAQFYGEDSGKRGT